MAHQEQQAENPVVSSKSFWKACSSTSLTAILSVPIRMTSPIPPSRLAISILRSSCWAFQFLTRDSRGCRELRLDAVDARPWLRVSWTMGTADEPLAGLRIVGTDEEGGMNRSPFDYTALGRE
jgi:hypothetical protein